LSLNFTLGVSILRIAEDSKLTFSNYNLYIMLLLQMDLLIELFFS
jgi:hypothetical protein